MSSTTTKKYSASVSVRDWNGYHVDFAMHDKMILEEYDHDQVTRAKAATGRNGVEEFKAFVTRLRPHAVYPPHGDVPEDLEKFLLESGYEWRELEYAPSGWFLNA